MTSAELRQKGLDLVTSVPVKELSIPVRIELAQALATLEVAAQLVELNERLSNLTSWGSSGNALRVEQTP